jgi:hypothetical protein
MSMAATVAVLALSMVTAPVALGKGRPLAASLTGANEVPGPGDPDGSGTARLRLNQGKGRICYAIEVTGIVLPATAAHIHVGATGVSGAPVVTLGVPAADGTVEGCVEGVAKATIKAIRKHPADYYVNVHDSTYQAGAVRGQLRKAAPAQ